MVHSDGLCMQMNYTLSDKLYLEFYLSYDALCLSFIKGSLNIVLRCSMLFYFQRFFCYFK